MPGSPRSPRSFAIRYRSRNSARRRSGREAGVPRSLRCHRDYEDQADRPRWCSPTPRPGHPHALRRHDLKHLRSCCCRARPFLHTGTSSPAPEKRKWPGSMVPGMYETTRIVTVADHLHEGMVATPRCATAAGKVAARETRAAQRRVASRRWSSCARSADGCRRCARCRRFTYRNTVARSRGCQAEVGGDDIGKLRFDAEGG